MACLLPSIFLRGILAARSVHKNSGVSPMAWRVVEHQDQVWKVSVAAERCANMTLWQLVLAFRCGGPDSTAFWAPYPIQSTSKSSLFAQADRIPDNRIAEVLAENVD